MIVYIIMITSALILAFIEEKTENKKLKWLFVILTAIPFIIVSSIRYDVGTDYLFRYVPNYNTFVSGDDVDSLEILFRVLIKLCTFVTSDHVILFIISSILIIMFFLIGIKNCSKSFFMSILIFFIGSFFFQSMNIMRQYIAMAILFISYRYLFEKNKMIFWAIFLIIATLFHTMSAIFIVAILLDKKIIDYKFLIISLFFIIILGKPVINVILNLTSVFNITNIAKYQHYLEQKGDLPISSIVVEFVIYIYLLFIYYKCKKNHMPIEKETVFLLNVQTLSIIFTVMNIYIDLFFRIQLLFSMFQIISIPYFYFVGKEYYKKYLKIGKLNINLNIILVSCVLIIMSSRMIYSNIIKGADEILPYKTIFERGDR